MKNRTVVLEIGILIYVAVTAIDRFAHPLTNAIYIPLVVIGLVLMALGSSQSGSDHR